MSVNSEATSPTDRAGRLPLAVGTAFNAVGVVGLAATRSGAWMAAAAVGALFIGWGALSPGMPRRMKLANLAIAACDLAAAAIVLAFALVVR